MQSFSQERLRETWGLSHQHLDSSWPQAKPNKMNLNNLKCLSDTFMSWVCGRKAIASASFIFHLNTLQVCLRMRLDADLNMMQHWGWKCGLCLGPAEVMHVRTGRPDRGGVRFDCRDAAFGFYCETMLSSSMLKGARRCCTKGVREHKGSAEMDAAHQ